MSDYYSWQWPRRLLWVTIIAVVVFFSIRAYYRWTDDFRLANITYELPHNSQWETNLSQEEYAHLVSLLKQPFTYVGKGAQAYAFASKDRKYVVKFFKFKHLKPNSFLEKLDGLPFITEYHRWQSARKQRLVQSVFKGHKLAYDVHKKESGIIFLHLNKTSHLKLKVSLIDKLGFKRSIDLDSVIFVIQEYAQTTRQAMAAALDKGDLALAKKRMDGILELYLLEYQKGIYDRDHGVMHNTGFVQERAIHLDVGKLTKDEKIRQLSNYRQDLVKVVKKFEIWMRKNYPQYSQEFLSFLEARLTGIFGEKFEFS
jgi:hypothetical protein